MESKSENQVVKEEVKIFTGFKKHLLVFLVVLVILWITWFITGSSPSLWPLYPSIAWVIILSIHFISAYRGIERRNKDMK